MYLRISLLHQWPSAQLPASTCLLAEASLTRPLEPLSTGWPGRCWLAWAGGRHAASL